MSERQKQVYAVVSGDYSDYSVHAIFERKEDAEVYAKPMLYDVEEFDFYAAGEIPLIPSPTPKEKEKERKIAQRNNLRDRARGGDVFAISALLRMGLAVNLDADALDEAERQALAGNTPYCEALSSIARGKGPDAVRARSFLRAHGLDTEIPA